MQFIFELNNILKVVISRADLGEVPRSRRTVSFDHSFKKWSDVIKASTTEDRLIKVLNEMFG